MINVLAQGHNTVTPVRLKPAAPRPQVKHSTIEPLRSLNSSIWHLGTCCIAEQCRLRWTCANSSLTKGTTAHIHKWILRPNGPQRKNTWLCCMRTTNAQIRLHIRAVWSALLLFVLWKVLWLHLLRAKCQYSSLSRNMASLATCKMSKLKLVSYYGFICYVQNVNTQASLVLWLHSVRAKWQYSSYSCIMASLATCKMSMLKLVSYYAFICYRPWAGYRPPSPPGGILYTMIFWNNII